ncbi:hypothetical protein PMAYCL1PPCAC_25062 [Pristionchus mayeri]|uniref:Uncharacterized protein n=1 Tax=Pristionchus mayeri TaxID=1317129 RepID=A0AAN5I6Z8_9BILA|nr:hypothetical protein PMAYCL1PPCAC_25062 [Pristionchus mayeri]
MYQLYFSDATVERLLGVADYFQVKMILDQAEDYLIASTAFTVAAKLKLSGEYRLVHLQGQCLKSFTKIADIKKLKEAKEYAEFSDATKLSLLEKIMKLPE